MNILQNNTMGKIDLRAILCSKISNKEPWYIDIILKRCFCIFNKLNRHDYILVNISLVFMFLTLLRIF